MDKITKLEMSNYLWSKEKEMLHGVRRGLQGDNAEARVAAAKWVRHFVGEGFSQRETAHFLSVSRHTISNAVAGRGRFAEAGEPEVKDEPEQTAAMGVSQEDFINAEMGRTCEEVRTLVDGLASVVALAPDEVRGRVLALMEDRPESRALVRLVRDALAARRVDQTSQ